MIALFLGGCNLMESYEEVRTQNVGTDFDAGGCEPGETATCPCASGATGSQSCKSDGTWGPCSCADGSSDASDPDGRTPPVDTDSPSDGEPDADNSVDTGLPDDQCPQELRSYRIRPARTDPTIDADCSEAEFGHAAEIEFPASADTTNNDPTCRLVWLPDSNRVHGCCVVEDDDFDASATSGDAPETIWEPGGPGDDRLEYWVKCNLEPERDDCSFKTFINNYVNEGGDKGTPTYVAHRYDESNGPDFSREANEDASVERRSDSWALEWSADIGFDPAASQTDHTALCQFAIMDTDFGEDNGTMCSFGESSSVNEPQDWGCCFWEPASE